MSGRRAHPSLIWKSVVLIIALFAITASAAIARPVRAQPEAFFPVFVLACDAYVQMKGSAAGFGYPPECRGVAEVTVTAFDTQGARLDACTTDAEGMCRLAIDYNGVRIFREATDNIPDGYRPESDVRRVFTYTEFAEIAFHNYREDVLPARDAARATVRVHSRICPDRYTGDSFFEDCNPGVPTTNQWIFGSDSYARAGKDGDAVLPSVAAGADAEIIGGQGLDTGDVFFYCSLTDDPSVRIPTSVEVTALYDGVTRDFVGMLELEPDSDVTCDWYQIPFLDRGLWDSVVNVLASDESTAMYEGAAGNIELTLYRCPEGYRPQNAETAAGECTNPEHTATVRATGDDGTEHDAGTTDSAGQIQLSLSGMKVSSFWITLDGHARWEQDAISCVANRMGPPGDPMEPLYQATVVDGAAWTIPGFGDDLNGITCTWYLVPTGT